MKKSILFTVVALAAVTASAADITKEAFLAKKKAQAETAGTAYVEKNALGYFNRVDTNQDGVMSDAEQAAEKAAQAAKKEAQAAEKAAK